MNKDRLYWSIQPMVASVQFGNSLFKTVLPIIIKDRCINATRDIALNSTSMDSWQSTMSNFYMIYKIVGQLMPIIPGLFLAWLGDRGWRKTPLVVPLIGHVLARILMLLMLTLDWPLEVLWVEATITGFFGSFTVFWGGTMAVLSLDSVQHKRSQHMMTAELTNGIAGILGCVASGYLFDWTAFGLRPGVMTMVVCILLYALSMLYILFFLQVHVSRDYKHQQKRRAQTVSEQGVNVVLLWLAGLLYGAAVSAAKNILVLFQLMGPLHWSVTQVGYGEASGFLVILSSFMSTMLLSRWFSDPTLIVIGQLSYAVGIFCMAFVTSTYMFYIARSLTLFSLMPTPIIRSLLSQQVHSSSYGVMLISLQLSLKVSGVVFVPVFTKVYQETLNWFPGCVFIVSSILAIVAIIPIRILGRRLVEECWYQRVYEDKEADTVDLLPLTSGISDSIR